MKKTLNGEKGITLVALVVTIVVLLILAGVSINMVIGNNGIVNRALQAQKETEIATVSDILGLAIGEYTFDKYDGYEGSISEYLLNKGYLFEDNGYIYVDLDKIGQINKTGNGNASNKEDVYILEDDYIVYYDEDGNRRELINIYDEENILPLPTTLIPQPSTAPPETTPAIPGPTQGM